MTTRTRRAQRRPSTRPAAHHRAAAFTPDALSVGARHLEVGNEWVSSFAVTGFPGRRLGDDAEFTIGGPDANPRMVAHMETFLPGLTMDRHDQSPGVLPIRVGGVAFSRVRGKEEYVALAKIVTDDGAPIFVLCGQTSTGNHAAARYVSRGYRQLCRKYGATGQFCLVLKIVNPWAYEERKVELVADVTNDAFATPPLRRDNATDGGDRENHAVANQEAHD